jgi:hypothetical protein
MRALALTMDDPEVVILMTDLAADYEIMLLTFARTIELRAARWEEFDFGAPVRKKVFT